LSQVGIDTRAALERFFGRTPAWLEHAKPQAPSTIAAMLDDLRGSRSIADLARAAGRTRSTVSRWLSGRTEPSLPDLLLMIEVSSLRMLDFVSELVDPARVPALADHWRMLEASRHLAREAPWSHAVLRALELRAYQRLPRHRPGWIARRLGLTTEIEARSLSLLEASGQVRRVNGRYVPSEVMTVDTHRDPRAEQALRAWCARAGLARMQRKRATGLFSHNLFTVSDADLARLHELQRAFFRQLRTIVANSAPADRVVVANVQVFGLD
jgi:transcriptional regulator with XRE-family HTH domain